MATQLSRLDTEFDMITADIPRKRVSMAGLDQLLGQLARWIRTHFQFLPSSLFLRARKR